MRWSRLVGFDPTWSWQIDFALPFHAPMPRRRLSLDEATATSGLMTAWEDGNWSEFEFETWRIPTITSAGVTGWYGADGVEAFIVEARRKKPFRLILDRDVPAVYRTVQAVSVEDEREPLKVQYYRARWHVRAIDTDALIEI